MSAMLAAVALAVGACGRDDTSAGAGARSGVELVKDGTITTCTHLSYRPFEFEQDGKIVGFDVDMIDLVAKKLGVRRSIVDTPFEGIQSGEQLNARKCDIAAAAMTITPERRRKIAFSSPYFDANQALLVRKDGAVGSLRDLAGRTLGVLAGTTGQLYAEKHAPPGAHLKDYKDLALLLGSVKSGRIHAAVNDLPVLLDYVKHHAGLKVATRIRTGEQYGFGMNKTTSKQLAQTVNGVIERAKADGTYDGIYEKWFGAKPR